MVMKSSANPVENFRRQEQTKIVPCQVFLIEDDADDRALAQRSLQSCAYIKEIVSFCDGRELTDYMHERGFMDHSVLQLTPILLLVDLEMPKKDGLEVIHELKSDPFLEEIPLIVITGTESREKLEKARELGANGVFRKPLTSNMVSRFFKDAWQWPPRDFWPE